MAGIPGAVATAPGGGGGVPTPGGGGGGGVEPWPGGGGGGGMAMAQVLHELLRGERETAPRRAVSGTGGRDVRVPGVTTSGR